MPFPSVVASCACASSLACALPRPPASDRVAPVPSFHWKGMPGPRTRVSDNASASAARSARVQWTARACSDPNSAALDAHRASAVLGVTSGICIAPSASRSVSSTLACARRCSATPMQANTAMAVAAAARAAVARNVMLLGRTKKKLFLVQALSRRVKEVLGRVRSLP